MSTLYQLKQIQILLVSERGRWHCLYADDAVIINGDTTF